MYCVYGNCSWYIHGGPLFGGGPLLGGSVIGGSTVSLSTVVLSITGFPAICQYILKNSSFTFIMSQIPLLTD